jgi:biotin transport system substrate-specific component
MVLQGVWIFGFAAATALGAQVEIPHYPVPYTLQTLFVLLSGAFLGPRNGALSQVLYLVAGIAGVPVFSGGAMGLARLLGPTGGYLLAFPLAAMVVGLVVQQRHGILWSFLSMAAGLVLIFLCGTIQLYAVLLHSWSGSFAAGFLIFSWWDLLKLSAAAMIYHEIGKRWKRIPGS